MPLTTLIIIEFDLSCNYLKVGINNERQIVGKSDLLEDLKDDLLP